jgi:hypothetical protein
MTAAWAAAAMLDALRADLDRVLGDEHADRQLIAERTAAKLATVAAAFHAAADQADDGEDTEPHCATCGQWIGIFHGLDGWQHFCGDPAPGGQRELYDPGHQATPAWCVPPGRALSPAQCRIIGQALAEAITYQLHYLGGCVICGHDPAETYPDQIADTGQAHAYGELITVLAPATPEITGEDR